MTLLHHGSRVGEKNGVGARSTEGERPSNSPWGFGSDRELDT